MMDPWDRIRQDWPAVFTATTASLVAVTILQSKITDLTSLQFWKSFLSVFVSVGVALIMVYFFVYLVIHKLRHKLAKEEKHVVRKIEGKRERF